MGALLISLLQLGSSLVYAYVQTLSRHCGGSLARLYTHLVGVGDVMVVEEVEGVMVVEDVRVTESVEGVMVEE